jgi:hypothetical protein
MTGKLKITGDINTPRDPMNVKAYCEGRQAAKDGGATTDDPHPANSPSSVDWLAGFTSWAADPAGVPRDCCAIPYGGGYVAP